MAATLIGFTGTVLPQELEDLLLPSSPLWDTATTLRAGGGYKDNVFLSSVEPEAAAFVSAEAEFIALRVAGDAPQFTLFTSADARHYFTPGSGHNDYTAFAQAEVEMEFSPRWKVSLGVFYFFQDQVLDVSATEQVRQSLQTVGHTFSAHPAVRVNLPGGNWLAVEPGGLRQLFEEPLDNYWEADTKLTAGHSYGAQSELTLSYTPSWRCYDTELALDAEGKGIPGSSRERLRHDARLSWRHVWDKGRTWRTSVSGGLQAAQENAGGYFDYSRWLIASRLEYRPEPWRFAVDARYSEYDYANEPANPGSASNRRRTDLCAGGRIERALHQNLRLVLYAEHTETTSNAAFEEYSVNVAGALLAWEF